MRDLLDGILYLVRHPWRSLRETIKGMWGEDDPECE